MTTATEMLAAYIAAEAAVLKMQAFTLAGRQMTRANLAEIRAGRLEWEAKVKQEQRIAAGTSSYALADFRCRS